MLDIVLALLAAFMSSVSSLLQKSGLKKARYMFFSSRWMLGTLILVLSFFLYVLSLKIGQLIIIQTLLNSSILFIVILEIIFFKSKIKRYEILSMTLFFLGIILIEVSL